MSNTKPKASNDTQDEIDKIMSEIESLQKELGNVGLTADSIVAEEATAQELVISELASESEPAPEESLTEPTAEQPESQVVVDEINAELAAEILATQEKLAESVVESDDTMAEFRGGSGEPGLEETLGELKEETPGHPTLLDSVFEQPSEGDEPVSAITETPRSSHKDSEEGSEDGALSMTLKGRMTLKLKYEFEGEEISIGFADNALLVQLSDGTEFKIPVRRKTSLRRVA